MGPGPRFEPESQDPQSRRMTAYPTPEKSLKMGPGPRFEPESQDPQSRRMTAYPTPANEYHNRNKN